MIYRNFSGKLNNAYHLDEEKSKKCCCSRLSIVEYLFYTLELGR
jgi:hypothetical protein